ALQDVVLVLPTPHPVVEVPKHQGSQARSKLVPDNARGFVPLEAIRRAQPLDAQRDAALSLAGFDEDARQWDLCHWHRLTKVRLGPKFGQYRARRRSVRGLLSG